MKKVTKKAAKKKVTKKVAKKTTKKAAKKKEELDYYAWIEKEIQQKETEEAQQKEKTTKPPLTKAQIKKFKKLEDEADNNTEMTGYYIDEFDYCYGNLAEDLCYAGDKEWARRIYKIVEDKMGIGMDSTQLLQLAGELANTLGDKEWAKKVYQKAEGKAKDPSDFSRLKNSRHEKLGVIPI